MSQIYNDNTKRSKPKQNKLWFLGISARGFTHFAENSAEGLRSRREHCWGYVSVYENTHSYGIFPLKSCHNFNLWFKEWRS